MKARQAARTNANPKGMDNEELLRNQLGGERHPKEL